MKKVSIKTYLSMFNKELISSSLVDDECYQAVEGYVTRRHKKFARFGYMCMDGYMIIGPGHLKDSAKMFIENPELWPQMSDLIGLLGEAFYMEQRMLRSKKGRHKVEELWEQAMQPDEPVPKNLLVAHV